MSRFRDAYDEFRRLNVEVAGVSVDSAYTHRVWAKELNIEFPMISDFLRTMLDAYGALGPEREYLGRIAHYNAIVVAQDGTIAYAWYQPETGGLSPVEEVLEAVRALPDGPTKPDS